MSMYLARHGVDKAPEDLMPKLGAPKATGMGPEVYHAFLEAADAA